MPSVSTPRDPSRSCADLQSIKLRTVAARLASRLRLRPLSMALTSSRPQSPRPNYRSGWLLSWPFTLPQGSTGRPRSNHLAADAHRSTPGRPLMRFFAPPTLPTWRIHFPEPGPETTTAGAVHSRWNLPSEDGSTPSGFPSTRQGRQLPDSRRIGCRRWQLRRASRYPSEDKRLREERGSSDRPTGTRIGSEVPIGGHPVQGAAEADPVTGRGPFQPLTRRSPAVGTSRRVGFGGPRTTSARAVGRRSPPAVSRRIRPAASATLPDQSYLSSVR